MLYEVQLFGDCRSQLLCWKVLINWFCGCCLKFYPSFFTDLKCSCCVSTTMQGFYGIVVQWLTLLCCFIQQSLNSGSMQIEILLIAYQFAMVKILINVFHRSLILENNLSSSPPLLTSLNRKCFKIMCPFKM